MASPLVAARVPQTQKDSARDVLAQLGATTTDLIQAAFEYVIETHQLPSAPNANAERTSKDFASFLSETTIPIDWPSETVDYKELISEAKRADYEALT